MTVIENTDVGLPEKHDLDKASRSAKSYYWNTRVDAVILTPMPTTLRSKALQKRTLEELDPNTFETPSVTCVCAEDARSRSLSVTRAQAAAADTALNAQEETHQYSNDDTPGHSADTKEGRDHHYASAAPPLPVCDGEDNSSPGATGLDPLQAVPGQPASQIDESESDEEERPYGMAAANSAYEDTNLYQNEIVSGNHNPGLRYSVVNATQSETTPSIQESRNSLYGQQPENMTMVCDSTRSEDLDVLYGNCPATDE
ncbi:hypothetical protein Bbelb_101790 [Branchiostoma belcheri]|nr:hypothetical protein Bbelb_101790 [Branchiostoma belcheri]